MDGMAASWQRGEREGEKRERESERELSSAYKEEPCFYLQGTERSGERGEKERERERVQSGSMFLFAVFSVVLPVLAKSKSYLE